MGIYMAPSVVLFTAYLGLSGSGFNLPFAYALMGYALFILAALTFSLKWLKQQAFAPGYWAYTFGIATLSQGLSAFTAVNSNINGLALTVFILMNTVTLSVMIGSVKLVIKGSYFPK
jgi:tellurite resistance protein